MENPDHKKTCSNVCLTCVAKILYRDALFEMMNKLEVFDKMVNTSQAYLKEEEAKYDKILKKQNI